MGNYWIYVVDNPQRDLACTAWWVFNSSLHSGHKVCLLPMSELSAELLADEKPDVIVWNYIRSNNANLIRKAKNLNIYNIVHDTEGIPYYLEKFFSGVEKSELKNIDEVWVWGQRQAEIVKRKTNDISKEIKIKVTGSIRYEYAKSLPKCDFSKNIGNVIWNTNFGTISPKFQTSWKEFTEHFDYELLSPQATLDRFIEHAGNRQASLEFIRNNLKRLDNINLTIRPHPFESSLFYEEDLAIDFKEKIRFSKKTDIQQDLSENSLVIQYGCQTALDSYIRGVPSVRPYRKQMNLWTAVTPYFEHEELAQNINSEDFLNSILEKQRDLFIKNNISDLLFNLNKDITLKSKILRRDNNKDYLSGKFKGFLYEKTIKIKANLKKIISTGNKISKLSSSDINNFLDYHYREESWEFAKLNYLYPHKNKLD